MSTTTKYAVIAGGGGLTGAFEVGAILRLHEAGIRPSLSFGISVGSLNTALWMQNDVALLVELWQRIGFSDIFGPKRSLLSAYAKGGLHSNAPLKRLIDQYVDPKRLPDTYHAGLVNLSTRTYVAASKRNGWAGERIKTAILASTAVPVQHQFVRYYEDAWVDGGVYSVLPLGHAIDVMNRDVGGDGQPDDHLIILSCHPETQPAPRRFEVNNLLDVASGAVGMMVDLSPIREMRQFRLVNYLCQRIGGTIPREDGQGVYRYIPATIIQPDHHLGSGMDADRDRLDALYLQGYQAASKALASGHLNAEQSAR